MKNKKEKNALSFDYLGLDMCKNDKEKAVKLISDIEKRKTELKQVKKKYKEVLENILDSWKKEVETEFPSLPIQTHSSKGGDFITMFVYNGVHYEIVLGHIVGKYKFICMIRVELEDFRNDKRLDDVIVSKFKEVLPIKYTNYGLYKEFDITELDDTISCYIELINRFKELSK